MGAFWQEKSLAEMNGQEWEQLCDGCGKCCLHKLEDEDDGEVYYTDVACRYLDLKTARCRDYPNRVTNVPACVNITPDNIGHMPWLPASCAYRLLHEGKPLPLWHPLIARNARTKMKKKGVSVIGRVVSEEQVHPDDLQDRVIRWV